MRNLDQHKRTAIEAVARRFGATLKEGSGSADAFLLIERKRCALDLATFSPNSSGSGTPRLRFDKVVNRVMGRLQSALGPTVPDGTSVLLTLTAPIRLPAKTASALEEKILNLLKRKVVSPDALDTLHGNRVQIRIVKNEFKYTPKFIGFVHNSDTDPRQLLNMSTQLLQLISTKAARRSKKLANERWLVVCCAEEFSCLNVYCHIYSQLRIATDYRKIILVFGDLRLGELPSSNSVPDA